MSLFHLSEHDKGKLERLSKQKETVSSLKKLFLNAATKGTIPPNTQTLAAERIAIDIIRDVFRQLEAIKPDDKMSKVEENLV